MKELLNKIHHADCLEFMKQLPDKCIDLVVTSPPYNYMLRVHSGKYTKRGEPHKNKYTSNLTDSLTIDEYFEFQKKTIYELLRITKKEVFYNIQLLSGNKPALLRLFGEFAYKIKEVLIWDKVTTEPAIGYGCANSAYEFIIVFCDDAINRQFLSPQFKRGTFDNILRIGKQQNNELTSHKATFPLQLPKVILKNFAMAEDLILDCFSGSGTTALACHDLGLDFICIEKDADYHKASVERLEQHKRQLKLI